VKVSGASRMVSHGRCCGFVLAVNMVAEVERRFGLWRKRTLTVSVR
jgi:hypothetical protein